MIALTVTDFASLILAGVCLALAASVWLQHRRGHALTGLLQTERRRVDRLEADLGAVLACSRQVGERIGAAERADRTLRKQLDQLALARDDGQVAVEHAMKLLASGQSMDEVVQICDLSAGEVEILQNLSRFRSAA